LTRAELIQQIRTKQSFLCVGLDPDLSKIPSDFKPGLNRAERVLHFCKLIIDATAPYCVAYKPNLAFFESLGVEGFRVFGQVLSHIPATHLSIADAKRGDIGNTAARYAKTFFEVFESDAITIAPYMGADSVTPFLKYPGKWSILLALTSNASGADFQFHSDGGLALWEKVMILSQEWGSPENTMYVIGATKTEYLAKARALAPDHFFLVPGVGAQGGSLEEVMNNSLNPDIGLLVNSSRGINYAGKTADTIAEGAAEAAQKLQKQMSLAF